MRIRMTKDDKILLKAVFNSLMKDAPEALEQYPDDICEMDIVLADVIKTFFKKGIILTIPKISKNIHSIISTEYNLHHDTPAGAEILAHYYLYKVGIATLLKYQEADECTEEDITEDEDTQDSDADES